METSAQESRTEKVAVSVTPREKLAMQLVAAKDGTDVSNLIRDRMLEGVLAEAEEIRAGLRGMAVSA